MKGQQRGFLGLLLDTSSTVLYDVTTGEFTHEKRVVLRLLPL